MKSNFYIYAHYTLDTNELFYIGKGSGKRAWKTTSRNAHWKNIFKKHGRRVEILIDNLTEDRAFIQEILGIKFFKPRANKSLGGEGSSGHKKSIKYLENISKRMSGSGNPMYGKSSLDYLTPEEIELKKQKHSAKTRQYWKFVSEEEKNIRSKKLSTSLSGSGNPMYGKDPWNKGVPHTLETKNKISLKRKGKSIPRKRIFWVNKGVYASASNIAKELNSHPQSIRQAARECIGHKGHTFIYE